MTTPMTEDEKRKMWARWALVGNLAWLHLAMTIVIYACIWKDKDNSTVREIFNALVWATPLSLLALISDKLADTWIKRKWSPVADVERTTTITETQKVAPVTAVNNEQSPGST